MLTFNKFYYILTTIQGENRRYYSRISDLGALALAGTWLAGIKYQVIIYFQLFLNWVIGVANAIYYILRE